MLNMIHTYFEYSQLSLAAYASLSTNMPQDDYIRALQLSGDGMSQSQAERFAAEYAVVDQFTDSESGFSATVFERAGQRYLAIRGTNDALDVIADFELSAVNGVAARQTIALFNYYQRLQGVKGQPVAQLEWNGQSYVLNPNGATGILDTPLSGPLVVTGHSLGGHLAQAFGRLFPQAVSQIYTYNAPGFLDAAANDFFARVDTALGRAGSSFQDAKTTNLHGSGLNIIAGYADDHGTPKEVLIENSVNLATNHSIVTLTDSLAVHDLFARMDNSLTETQITGILKAASATVEATLESAVNGLKRLFAVTAGDAVEGDRDSLYRALSAVRDALGSNASYSVVSLVAKPAAALTGLATNGDLDALAYRYALKELNPFAVLGADYQTLHNADGQLSLVQADGSGDLSAEWIADRARLLTQRLAVNETDRAPSGPNGIYYFDNATTSVRYEDRATGFKTQDVRAGGSALLDAVPRVIFGTDAQDFESDLTGSAQNDRIYAGAGDDRLTGGAGNDLLEGQSGNDVLTGGLGNDTLRGGRGYDSYIYKAGDGFDTIVDQDGWGYIEFDGVQLSGGRQVGANLWRSADGRFSYVLAAQSDGSNSLLIESGADRLTVKNFVSGRLGIELQGAAPAPTPQPTERVIDGDRHVAEFTGTASAQVRYIGESSVYYLALVEPLPADWRNVSFNPAVPEGAREGDILSVGVRYQRVDDLDNYLTDGSEPNRSDGLYDSAGADLIRSGGGDDRIQAYRGGDDRIEAGTGQDRVSAGEGNDVVLGGAGRDIVEGQAGDDRLYAAEEIDLAQAAAAGNSQTGTGQPGDWLNGSAGDDLLVAGADNDVLMGGAGRDILVGGAGDDVLDGDDDFVVTGFEWSVTDYGNPFDRSFNTAYDHNPTPMVGDADVLYGGAGNDFLTGLLGDDVLFGEDGHDTLAGDDGNDTLSGGAGDDRMTGDYGRLAYDSTGVIVVQGDDYLDGGAGNDFLQGEGGNDQLFGGAGNDELWGEAKTYASATLNGNDYLDGADGDDTLAGQGGSDELFGGAGNDQLFGDADDIAAENQGDDYLDGEDGNDYLRGYGGNDELFGGAGNDELLAEAGNDYLDGEAGDDTLDAGDGDDELHDGAGNDTLFGGAGNDTLYAEAGRDGLLGETGDDTYIVSSREATILDGSGTNTVVLRGAAAQTLAVSQLGAGSADLLLRYGPADDAGVLLLQGALLADVLPTLMTGDGATIQPQELRERLGALQLAGTAGNDRLQGGSQDDVLEGLAGDDRLEGNAGNDALYGGEGNDTLIGGAGADTLDGGAGDDTLYTGAGDDLLIGGQGQDSFVVELGARGAELQDADTGNILRFGEGISLASVQTSGGVNGGALYVRYGADAGEVELKNTHLDADGHRHALTPGMQVAAEIQLGTRSVLEYLLSPVQKAFHEAGRER